VDGSQEVTGTYDSWVIYGDFDGPTDNAYTTYEGIPAQYDSGGGWFYKDGSTWYLIALTRGVEHNPESWYRNDVFPAVLDPDYMDGVWVNRTEYRNWINGIIPEPGTLALLALGGGGLLLRRRRRRC
jgi:hypothetical protein